MKQIYTTVPRQRTIKKFLSMLPSERLYSSYKFTTTYEDKGCTVKQCGTARRSLDDIYRIVKPLYPTATYAKIAHAMMELGGGMLYCPDIRKVVFTFESTGDFKISEYKIFTKEERDDHNTRKNDAKGNGLFTRRDVFKMIKKYGKEQEQKKKRKSSIGKATKAGKKGCTQKKRSVL